MAGDWQWAKLRRLAWHRGLYRHARARGDRCGGPYEPGAATRMIAALALDMGVLPSALLREDADLLDALFEAAEERAKAVEEAARPVGGSSPGAVPNLE